MKRAVFESDYAPGTKLAIVQTDDGDIILKISGNGEMRIATDGGKLHGQSLVDCVGGFVKAINAINSAQDEEKGLKTYRETGLTPGGIANWIYRSTNPPDSEFEKTIRAVENALGFKLFVWQKTYIECERFRYMGDTTARILRDLLDVSAKPIDYTRGAATPRQQFYRRELREIKEKLDRAGIPTRTVFFSQRDKWDYKSRREEG